MPKKSKQNKRKQTKRTIETRMVVYKKPKQQPKKKGRRTGGKGSNATVSECGLKYFQAIANPFAMEAIGVCVPTSPARPSQKCTVRGRFIHTVGENDYGYVLIAPCLANNAPSFFSTAATYNGTPAIALEASACEAINATNMPHVQDSFYQGSTSAKPLLNGRIISVGVRWRYVGTMLDQGGRVYAYTEAQHGNLNYTYSTSIASRAEVLSNPVTTEWTTHVLTAIDQNEQDYANSSSARWNDANEAKIQAIYPFSSGMNMGGMGDAYIGGAPSVLIFHSKAGNQFEIEYVIHSEYIGIYAQQNLTASHSDIVAVSHAVEAAGSTLRQIVATGASWGSAFYRNLMHTYQQNHQTIHNLVGLAGKIGGLSLGSGSRALALIK